ncbi:hypothetical protein F5Y12DRAFT_791152 [Xylaria sp. FL1777]|nr:hypothetical protein F5Y12DRAFT_791152 [Xylaria sp. FL1777]
MDDVSTVRRFMEDDELTIALEDMGIETGSLLNDYDELAQEKDMPSTNIIVDHWPQPSPDLQVLTIPEAGEPADFVLCGGCGAAHIPAHRQCISSVPFHQPDQDGDNIYGSPCEEVDFQEYVYTSWLMDGRLRSNDQTALHLDDIWSTWLGIPDGQDGPHPQLRIYPRLERLIAAVPNKPPRQYPSLVTIIGDTGSGKSTLIAAMIRMLAPTAHKDYRVPIPGTDTDNFDSTSSDVHIFADPRTLHTECPFFFVDCEGFSGTDKLIARQLLLQAQQSQAAQPLADIALRKSNTSKSAKDTIAEHANTVSDRITLQWSQLFSPLNATSNFSRKGNAVVDSITRHIVVKSLYPRLLYSFSDVVCFVTNNSRSSHNILQEMFKWAREGHEKTLNQRVRPGLIIVLNKMTTGSHNALGSVNRATKRLLENFEQSTRFSELQKTWRSRGKEIQTAEELILCYYDSFRVVSVPQYTATSPATVKKTSDQIKTLYEEIGQMSELIRKKRQLLNPELDVASLNAYLRQALVGLGRDCESTIDFHQLSDGDYSLPRRFSEHLVHVMANVAKQRNFDTSQATGGEANLVSQMTPYIAACIVAQAENHESRDEAQKRKKELVEEARRGLERFRACFWRCEAKDSSRQRRCKNYWESHEKGHQFDVDQGIHRESGDNLAFGKFESSYKPEAFSERLWKEVTRLRSRRDAIDQLGSAAVSCSVASITGQRTCLACLSNTPTSMLPCLPKQHCICEDCIRRYSRENNGDSIIRITSCPLGCSLTKTPWTIRVKPPTAGARILSLDGGGVRGIAELAILIELERQVGMGIRIQELFDLVVGTSTGGIIALGVFERNWALVDAESRFIDLSKNIFSKRRAVKVPILSVITEPFCDFKYKTSGIESTLQDVFGQGHLFGQGEGRRNSGDEVKVGVVTCLDGRNQPCLIINYSRNPVAKLQDGREAYDCLQRAENQSEDFRTWQAARATSAAQTFFKPYIHRPTQMIYVDGATVRNNPVRLAYEEAKRIWKSGAPPDIVVSLGTGILVNSVGHIADKKGTKFNSVKKALPRGLRKMVKTGLDMVEATMDCNREWVDFKSAFHGRLGRNCHRLDIGLEEKPPSLDNLDMIHILFSSSRAYIRESHSYMTPSQFYMQSEYRWAADHIKVVARRLLASLFYLRDRLGISMPSGPFITSLSCRLRPQSEGVLNILAQLPIFRLKEVSADGEEIFHPVRLLHPDILDKRELSGSIELDISEGEYKRTVEVQFPRRGKHWEPIGGF